MKRFLAYGLVLLALAVSAGEEQKLWDAATKGDLAAVKQAIEAGTDVNATTQYGNTALSYACNKGHLEIVRYLLDKGATINTKDKFYDSSPISWAVYGKHFEIAKLLLERGADEVGMVLSEAIDQDQPALVDAALASKGLKPEHVASALAKAKAKNDQALLAKLEACPVKPPVAPEVQVSAEILKSYAGIFGNKDMGIQVELFYENGLLVSFGGPKQPLTVIAPTRMALSGPPELTFDFVQDASGKVTALNVTQGERTFPLVPGPINAPAPVAAAETTEKPEPSPAEAPVARGPQVQWPSFRGPNASGVADGQGAPLRWDLATGEGVMWKTPMPGIATASPVIWGNKVFLVTAISGKNDNSLRTGLYGDVDSVTDDSVHIFKVYCLAKDTGAILWEKTAAEQVPAVKRHLKSTQANSSPVTDGKNLVVCFGSIGLLLCYDLDGKELWRTDTGVLDAGWFFDKSYQWGHAASPVLYKDRVILLADVQETPFIAAYGLADGKQLWKTARSGPPAWGSPTIYEGARDEIVTNGKTIAGYDPATGKELWRLGPNSEVTVATPVVYQDRFYITAGYPPVRPIYVVKAGAQGDLTLPEKVDHSDSIVWSKDNGGTYMPTPIAYRDLFYTCANDGRLTCYNAQTGEQVYRARLGGSSQSVTASPIASDGRLYFLTEEGQMFVVQAGPVYKELAVNKLEGACLSTPALSDGVMVVSSAGMVYGLGLK